MSRKIKRPTCGSVHDEVLVSRVGDFVNVADIEVMVEDTLALRVRSGISSSLASDSGDSGVGLRRNCRRTALGANSVASRSMNP
jgi:hypothetical protein